MKKHFSMDNRRIALAALAIAALGVASAGFLVVRSRAAITEARVLRAEMALLTQARDDTNKQLLELRTERDRASAALGKAEAELEAAKRANIDLGNKLTGYSEELVRKQSEARQLSETQRQLLEQLRPEVDAQRVTIARLGNSLSLNLVGHLLFGSGQSDLTEEGTDVLTRLGAIIHQATDKTIRVVGHTDNRPISAARRALYPTNWELSAARATTVVRFLVDTVGIAPERCEAVGMGEFQPVATNETSAGRLQNRRLEVVLVPLPPKAEPVEAPTGQPVALPAAAAGEPAPTPAP